MKNPIKYTTLGLLAAALITLPGWSRAQDAGTNAPAVTAPATIAPATNAPPVHKKKKGALSVKGQLSAVDAPGATFTVEGLTLNITSTTKITTNSVPATLADFKVGDTVTVSYKKAADGTLNATSLKISTPKKKKAAAE